MGWNAIDQMFESCAWDSVARGCVSGCNTAGSGPPRSQWSTAPSEPPDTRIGCMGCHVTAIDGQLSDAVKMSTAYSRLPSCGL
jgi:hypothetical protein